MKICYNKAWTKSFGKGKGPMIRRKYVPLRIVQPGMMIDQAIIDRAGRVLIARRTRLEDFHIDALKKMGITGIYTCEGTEDVKPLMRIRRRNCPNAAEKV